MKIKSLLMTLCALTAFAVTSCKDEPSEPTPTPKPEEATLTVSPTSLAFGAAGESKSLTVKSNKDWTVTVPADASWLTASPMKGTGDGSISVKAAANVGPDGAAAAAREAKISVAIDGKKVDITVSQSAEAIVFAVSGDTATIPAEGGKVSVKVEYNETYTVGTLPEWITAGTKATKTDNLSFTVAANEAATERTGDITFSSASGKTGKVTVKQEGKKVSTKSLATAQDLKDFAAAVNSGDAAAIAAYDPDGDGIFKLEADIAFGGETITPIGNGKYVNATSYDGASFKKYTFDGQNHVIDNYVISESATSNCAIGFFGILDSAIVKNVVVGPKAKVSTAVAGPSHAGTLIGFAWDSDIENCTNKGSVDVTVGVDAKRSIAGGVLGGIIAKGKNCSVKGCVNEGSLTATNTVNKNNGASGFQIGGVVGLTDGATGTQDYYVTVENCVNKADLTLQATRFAGVVATSNKYTKLVNCTNEGNLQNSDVTASDSRTAGVTAAMGNFVTATGCKNSGKISFTVAGNINAHVAGIVGQINGADDVVDACENTGIILCDSYTAEDPNKFIGSILVRANSGAATVKNCKVEGYVGSYTGGEAGAVKVTKANFEDFITCCKGRTQNAKVVFEGNYCTVEDAPAAKELEVKTGEEFLAFLGDATITADPEYLVKLGADLDLASVTLPGSTDFACTIDGQGHSIKNWTNNQAAIFGTITGTLKNLVIDKSCVITLKGNANTSFLVLTNQGLIDGVINNADIAMEAAPSDTRHTGGFVAINRTTVQNCVNNGNITITSVDAYAKQLRFGVLIGSNAESGEMIPMILNCTNNGNISFAQTVAANTGARYIGGIVGVQDSKETSIVDGCANNGKISFTSEIEGSKAVYLGGIAGLLKGGTIKNCSNFGEISNVPAGTNITAGGIVGTCQADGKKVDPVISLTEGCVSKCKISGPAETSGLVLGNKSSTKGVQLGTDASPIKIEGSVNGVGATADNFATLAVGTSFVTDEINWIKVAFSGSGSTTTPDIPDVDFNNPGITL